MTSTVKQPSPSAAESQSVRKSSTTRFYGVKYLQEKTGGISMKDDTTETPAKAPQEMAKSCHINPRQYFREVYGPFLCTLLLTSILLVILGCVLTLSGYYVPRLSIKELVNNENVDNLQAIKVVEQHNATLSALRIAGVVLLTIGFVGMCILFIAPAVCLRRTEYTLLPETEGVKPRSSFSSTPTGLPENMFTFSVVKQHIQPRKQAKGIRTTAQHRSNYDKGFLSPELNRGPIFVSDETFNLHHEDGRIRSSSFDARLSPHPPYRHKRSASMFRIGSGVKSISPTEEKRLIPVKAGSFHSLHQ